VAPGVVRLHYLRAPAPGERFVTPGIGLRARWGVVFVLALLAEFALGLGPAAWREPFFALGRIVLGG
jgi:hypothetical protein